jgi:putative transferase (TIGR04331 family)
LNKKNYIVSSLSETYANPNLEPVHQFSLSRNKSIDFIDESYTEQFNISNKEDLINSCFYVEKKHERYLHLITERLNKIHKKNYSTEFWKRSFSQGLLRQITFLHQIFVLLEKKFKPECFELVTLSPDSFLIPADFEEQRNFIGSLHGQEQLFSIYIQSFYPKISRESFSIFQKKSLKNLFRDSLKKWFCNLVNFVKSCFVKKNGFDSKKCEVLLLGCFFANYHVEDLVKKSFGKIKSLSNIIYSKNYVKNDRLRLELGKLPDGADRFDEFFFKSLKYLFPQDLLEGFIYNISYSKKLLNQYPNLRYIVSEAWLSHTKINLFRAYAYDAQNVMTYYNEHNCIFHPFIGNFVDFQSKNVDKYLTFGWSSDSNKFFSTSSLFPFSIKKKKHIENLDILYVSNPVEFFFPTYSSSYSNWGYGSILHLRFVKSFFQSIPQNLKHKISYRSYPTDYQISGLRFNKEELLADYLKGVKFVSSFKFEGETCKEQMLSSNLVIVDFLSTSYLEALHMNIPTIAFWDPKTMSLKDEYNDFFDDLVNAKILHTTSKSAADHLLKVFENPNEWWNDKHTQDLKDAWLSRNFGKPEILKNYLLNLAKS